MTRFVTLALVACCSSAALACGGCDAPKAETPAAATPAAAATTATLAIEGMTCHSCSVTVRVAAKKLDGVQDVEVDVTAGLATVTFDSAKVTPQQIAAQISEAGYKTTVKPAEGT